MFACLSRRDNRPRPMPIGAGGKPSTWFPPERLVDMEFASCKHSVAIALAKPRRAPQRCLRKPYENRYEAQRHCSAVRRKRHGSSIRATSAQPIPNYSRAKGEGSTSQSAWSPRSQPTQNRYSVQYSPTRGLKKELRSQFSSKRFVRTSKGVPTPPQSV